LRFDQRVNAHPSSSASDYLIRAARRGDEQAIVGLIAELAAFENLSAQMQATDERLREHLFGSQPAAECWVVEAEGGLVAYAIFFRNFSTFLAKPGLYLEDVYVRPAFRGRGIGGALLRALGRLAVERGYGRFEWTVLDWNEGAIRFYRSLGATVLPEWRVCRMEGDTLRAFGDPTDAPAAASGA
jgi:GNAT superfamily N-acetyltransferase